MDEDPWNESFVLSLLEGYDIDEAEAMEIEPAPSAEDWRAKYLTWMDRGELPPDRSEARHVARMAKSFTIVNGELTSAPRLASCSGTSPSPTVASLFETSTRRRALLWVMRSTKAFIGPTWSLTPTRSCAPTKGANFTPARLISRLTPYKLFPSHSRSLYGGWTSSGPCERRPGATPTYWSSWTNSPS
jgi:hypothetical protein